MNNRNVWVMIGVFAVVVAFGSGVLVTLGWQRYQRGGTTGTSGETAATDGPPKVPDFTVSGQQLHDEYAANEAAANLKYLNKWVFLRESSGRLERTAEGYNRFAWTYQFPDEPMLRPAGSSAHPRTAPVVEDYLVCRFPLSQEKALGETKEWATSGIFGKVTRVEHHPKYRAGKLVVLEQCEVRRQ